MVRGREEKGRQEKGREVVEGSEDEATLGEPVVAMYFPHPVCQVKFPGTPYFIALVPYVNTCSFF